MSEYTSELDEMIQMFDQRYLKPHGYYCEICLTTPFNSSFTLKKMIMIKHISNDYSRYCYLSYDKSYLKELLNILTYYEHNYYAYNYNKWSYDMPDLHALANCSSVAELNMTLSIMGY